MDAMEISVNYSKDIYLCIYDKKIGGLMEYTSNQEFSLDPDTKPIKYHQKYSNED
jgi:hypothetical protein